MNETNHEYSNERTLAIRVAVLVLLKRRKLIVSVFAAVVLVMTIATFLMPRIYSATAKIMVERVPESEKALLFRMNFPSEYEKYDWINSEIEIIKSYPVAARVVQELGLDNLDGKDQDLSDAANRVRFEMTVEKFQKLLKVDNIGNSNIIEVGYESKGAALVATTVNKVIETYLKYRSEIHDESQSYDFFDEQIKLADEKLRDLEERQAAVKEKMGIISPQSQAQILLSKLADYEKSLTTVQTKRIGKGAKLSVILEQLQDGSDIQIPATDVSDSPSQEKYIAKLRGELLDMQIRRDQLMQRFKPTYDEILEIERNISATKEIIKNEIRQIVDQEKTAIKALRAEESALQEAIADINRKIKEFAQKEYEVAQISRGIDDSREVYSMLLKQREDARMSLARLERGAKIRVVSPAVEPIKPVKPRRRLNILMSIILGLSGGVGLAFLLEYFERLQKVVPELEQVKGFKLLGRANKPELES